MPIWTTATDLTTNNLPNTGARGEQAFAPSPTSAVYLPGSALQLVAIDKQLYPNHMTVQLLPAGTTSTKIAGVVNPSWPGFDNAASNPSSYTSVANTANLVRGTQFIEAVVKGISTTLVDGSGTGAVDVTDGIPLVSSRNTAGYLQGVAVATAGGTGGLVAVASLPSTGIGSTLKAAALAQATIDFTVATPAAGDIVNTIIQTPYTDAAPGTVQTTTWSYKLSTADAVSATTAALGILTYLNSQASFSTFFTATQTAGAVHVGVNANSAPFLVTFGSGTYETGRFSVGLSGAVANTLTTVGSVTGAGGTTYSAASGTFNGGTPGTGYKGTCPGFIYGEF